MKSILALLIVFYAAKCEGQNLVLNPSFEDTLGNPNWPSSGLIQNACLNWFSPLPGSADYLNDLCYLCPGCISLIRTPRSGNAYAGIYTFTRDTFFREAIQVQLTDTLVLGKTYCVSFFVSRYYVHNYSCGNLGVYFSSTPISNTNSSITSLVPQIDNDPQVNDLIDTSWTLISGEFIATGGERYLTITNFASDQQSDTLHVGSEQFTTMQQAYYFIDDVSVVECSDTLPIFNSSVDVPNIFTPNGDGNNDLFEVRAVELQTYNCTIYNRWGVLLFETTNTGTYWDGKNKSGQPCPDGTYFYFVEAVGTDNTIFSKRGFVTVVR